MARPKNCGKCNKPKRPKGRKFKELKGYCECGRPTVISLDVIQKLEDAFSNSFPDKEACFYAGISVNTLYNYQKEKPEFLERKNNLKLHPNMKARRTVVKSLENTGDAWKWLEKKDKDFMPTSKLQHAGTVEVTNPAGKMSKEEKQGYEIFSKARKKRLEDESDKME